jgi:hypothetical protein
MNALRAYWERFLALSPKEVLLSLMPSKYDSHLHQGTHETMAATPPLSTPLPITFEHYGPGEHTGNPEVDELVAGSREVCIAKVNGVIAHRCVLTFALPRTRQFGFPLGPLATLGYTLPKYRGLGLQPVMRRFMLEDVLNRGLSDYFYSEMASDDFASMKGNERGGLRRVARLQGLEFAGFIPHRRVLPPTA